MTEAVLELFAECESLGILLMPDGNGGLGIDAHEDALSSDLLERLKANKTDIIAALSADERLSGPADVADDEMPPSYFWCACGREWMVGPISKRDWCPECSVYADGKE